MKTNLILMEQDGQRILADEVILADGFLKKARGYLGYLRANAPQAVWLWNERSIHTFFMLFSLDVFFLDADRTVIDYRSGLLPFMVCRGPAGTSHVLEFPSRRIADPGRLVGERLLIVENDTKEG